MAAVLEQHTDDPEQSRLEALERMLAALCDEATRLTDDFRVPTQPLSRETELQLMALDERRDQALACLRERGPEPRQFRIGRLEKLVEALDCSWTYFGTRHDPGTMPRAADDWAVRVR